MTGERDELEAAAITRAVAGLTRRKLTLAVAESLTGGLISASFTSMPGSSTFFMGGIVCYQHRVKQEKLGIPEPLIMREGVVSVAVAGAMAQAVRQYFQADVGVSATGVAGPTALEHQPVGKVCLAVADEAGVFPKTLMLSGSRVAIRRGTVQAALELVSSYCEA